ncbi:MAG: cyclase family protein, partial [Gammaproteobacteria bacterium]
LERLAYGETPRGWFYAANRFCTPEHGGTHLDAPIHFYRPGQTAEQLPLEKLLAPGVRIDVRAQTQKDRNYR